jgi:hypothetical protein
MCNDYVSVKHEPLFSCVRSQCATRRRSDFTVTDMVSCVEPSSGACSGIPLLTNTSCTFVAAERFVVAIARQVGFSIFNIEEVEPCNALNSPWHLDVAAPELSGTSHSSHTRVFRSSHFELRSSQPVWNASKDLNGI